MLTVQLATRFSKNKQGSTLSRFSCFSGWAVKCSKGVLTKSRARSPFAVLAFHLYERVQIFHVIAGLSASGFTFTSHDHENKTKTRGKKRFSFFNVTCSHFSSTWQSHLDYKSYLTIVYLALNSILALYLPQTKANLHSPINLRWPCL